MGREPVGRKETVVEVLMGRGEGKEGAIVRRGAVRQRGSGEGDEGGRLWEERQWGEKKRW